MPRYKIIIEYLGTGLAGWQKQSDSLTVQGLVETAIYELTGENVIVYAAGRTDAGVHATGQVGHFDLIKTIKPFAMMGGINHFLRIHQVGIVDCELTELDFHARFSAKKRHYIYRINNRLGCVVIDRNKAWHVYSPLDIDAMQNASKYLIGRHDFTSFRATGCQSKSPIKTLDSLEIKKMGEEIHFSLSATSFLHHMVRNIVGTLVMVGKGKWLPYDVKKALAATSRKAAGPTAPACGLYFTKVEY